MMLLFKPGLHTVGRITASVCDHVSKSILQLSRCRLHKSLDELPSFPRRKNKCYHVKKLPFNDSCHPYCELVYG